MRPSRSTFRARRATWPGVTPMAERVAVLGLLNKRNGIVRDLTLKPGQAIRVKDVTVRLRACETTRAVGNGEADRRLRPDGRQAAGRTVGAALLRLALQGKPVAQRRRGSGLRRLAQELRDELAGRARRARGAFGFEQPVERFEIGRRQLGRGGACGRQCRPGARNRPSRPRPSRWFPPTTAPTTIIRHSDRG